MELCVTWKTAYPVYVCQETTQDAWRWSIHPAIEHKPYWPDHPRCWARYRILPNKRACLNKCALSTLWRNIPLKLGQNWSKISKNSSKSPGSPCVQQRVCQCTGSVYLARYGRWLLRNKNRNPGEFKSLLATCRKIYGVLPNPQSWLPMSVFETQIWT